MESNLFFPAFRRVFELSVQRQDAEAGPKSDAQPAHQRDRYYHERAVHQALFEHVLGLQSVADGDGPYGGRQRVGDVVARRRYPQIGYDREVQALGYAYHDGYGHGRAGGVVDDVGEDDVCRHDDEDQHELAVELYPGDELCEDLRGSAPGSPARRAPCRRRRGRRAPT